jgi:hypothetical protein
MRVLVGCEFSGAVRDAFRKRGHDAWSCDLLPSESDPAYHLQGDIRSFLDRDWDLLIAHPSCTYLCNSGVKWLYGGKGTVRDAKRWGEMEAAAAFFLEMWNAPIPKIAVENPIMHGHGKAIIGVEQSQIIQPWQFGHEEMKSTCLWLRNLPLLQPTNIVGPPPTDPVERKKWAKVANMVPGPNRWRERSRTYSGIADAMAEQWG